MTALHWTVLAICLVFVMRSGRKKKSGGGVSILHPVSVIEKGEAIRQLRPFYWRLLMCSVVWIAVFKPTVAAMDQGIGWAPFAALGVWFAVVIIVAHRTMPRWTNEWTGTLPSGILGYSAGGISAIGLLVYLAMGAPWFLNWATH